MADSQEDVHKCVKLMRNPIRKSLKSKKLSKKDGVVPSDPAFRQQEVPVPSESDISCEEILRQMSIAKNSPSTENIENVKHFNSPVIHKSFLPSEQERPVNPHPFFQYTQRSLSGVNQMSRYFEASEGPQKVVTNTLQSLPKKMSFHESNKKYLLAALRKHKSDTSLKVTNTLPRTFDDARPKNEMPRKSKTIRTINKDTKSLLTEIPLKIYDHDTLPKNSMPKKTTNSSTKELHQYVKLYNHMSSQNNYNCMPPNMSMSENQTKELDAWERAFLSKDTVPTQVEQPLDKVMYYSDSNYHLENCMPPNKPKPGNQTKDLGLQDDAVSTNVTEIKTVTATTEIKKTADKAVHYSDPESLPKNCIPPNKPVLVNQTEKLNTCDNAFHSNVKERKKVTATMEVEKAADKTVHYSDPDSLPKNCMPSKTPSSGNQYKKSEIDDDSRGTINKPRKTATESTISVKEFTGKITHYGEPDSLPKNCMPEKGSIPDRIAEELNLHVQKPLLKESELTGITNKDNFSNSLFIENNKKTSEKLQLTQVVDPVQYSDPESLPKNNIPTELSQKLTTPQTSVPIDDKRIEVEHPKNEMPKRPGSKVTKSPERAFTISNYCELPKNDIRKPKVIKPVSRVQKKEVVKTQKRVESELASTNIKQKTQVTDNGKRMLVRSQQMILKVNDDILKKNKTVRNNAQAKQASTDVNAKARQSANAPEHIQARSKFKQELSPSNPKLSVNMEHVSAALPNQSQEPLQGPKNVISQEQTSAAKADGISAHIELCMALPSNDKPNRGQEMPCQLNQETSKYESLKSIQKPMDKEKKLINQLPKTSKKNLVMETILEALDLKKQANTTKKIQALSQERTQARPKTIGNFSRDCNKHTFGKPPLQNSKLPASNQKPKYDSQPALKKRPTSKERPQNNEIKLRKDSTLKPIGGKKEIPTNVRRELAATKQVRRPTTVPHSLNSTLKTSPKEALKKTTKPPPSEISIELKKKQSLHERKSSSFQRQVEYVYMEPNKTVSTIGSREITPFKSTNEVPESCQQELETNSINSEQAKQSVKQNVEYKRDAELLKSTAELLQQNEPQTLNDNKKKNTHKLELLSKPEEPMKPFNKEIAQEYADQKTEGREEIKSLKSQEPTKPNSNEMTYKYILELLRKLEEQTKPFKNETMVEQSFDQNTGTTETKPLKSGDELVEQKERAKPNDNEMTFKHLHRLLTDTKPGEQTKSTQGEMAKQSIDQNAEGMSTKEVKAIGKLVEQKEPTKPKGNEMTFNYLYEMLRAEEEQTTLINNEIAKQSVDHNREGTKETKSASEILEQKEPKNIKVNEMSKPSVNKDAVGTREAESSGEIFEQKEKKTTNENEIANLSVGQHKKGTYTQTNKAQRIIDVSKQQDSAQVDRDMRRTHTSQENFKRDTSDKTVKQSLTRKTSTSHQKVVKTITNRQNSMGDVIVEKRLDSSKKPVLKSESKVSRPSLVNPKRNPTDEARSKEQVKSILDEYDRYVRKNSILPTTTLKLRRNQSDQTLLTKGEQQVSQAAVPPTVHIIPHSHQNLKDNGDYPNNNKTLNHLIPEVIAQERQRPQRAVLPPKQDTSKTQDNLSKPKPPLNGQRWVTRRTSPANVTARMPRSNSCEETNVDTSQFKIAKGSKYRRQQEVHKPTKSDKYMQSAADTMKTTGIGGRCLTPKGQQLSMHNWSNSDTIYDCKGMIKVPDAKDTVTTAQPKIDEGKIEKGNSFKEENINHSTLGSESTKTANVNEKPPTSEVFSSLNHSLLSSDPLAPLVVESEEAANEARAPSIPTEEHLKTEETGKVAELNLSKSVTDVIFTTPAPSAALLKEKTSAVAKTKKPFRLEDDDEFEMSFEVRNNHPRIKPLPEEAWFNECDLGDTEERTVNVTAGQTHPRLMRMTLPPMDSKPVLRGLAATNTMIGLCPKPTSSEVAKEAQVTKPEQENKVLVLREKATTATDNTSAVTTTFSTVADNKPAVVDIPPRATLTISAVTDKTSAAPEKITAAMGNWDNPLAVNNTKFAVTEESTVTPNQTISAIGKTSSGIDTPPAINKKPSEVNTKCIDNRDTLKVTKPQKPIRLEDDDEFEVKFKDTDQHPKIKTVEDAAWLKNADMGEIMETSVNIPEGQTHPRLIKLKHPIHPSFKPLSKSAWMKTEGLGDVAVKTVEVSSKSFKNVPILPTNSKQTNTTDKLPEKETTHVLPTQAKASEKVSTRVVPTPKQPGWQPEVLHKAVESAAKGLQPQSTQNTVGEETNTNIEDLILAKLNSKIKQFSSEPNNETLKSEHAAAPKDEVPPQIATTSNANQEYKIPEKEAIRPTYIETITEGTKHQNRDTFKSQIQKKELQKIIQEEFQRRSLKDSQPLSKPVAKPGIEIYNTHPDIPELPDVDSLIREPWSQNHPHSRRLNGEPSQIHTAQLNIKLLREEMEELKNLHKIDKPPIASQPQNNMTQANSAEITQQMIEKIPVQGENLSGKNNGCVKVNEPTNATQTIARPEDSKMNEPMKLATLKKTGEATKPFHAVQVVQKTPNEVTSKVTKNSAQIRGSRGQPQEKSLQNEIKTYVRDLHQMGHFQHDSNTKSDKQSIPSHFVSRQGVKQSAQTTGDNTHKKLIPPQHSLYKQSDAPKSRYQQIKYPQRLRTHSSHNNERVKTSMQSEGRPSTSSGEQAPTGSAAKGNGENPPPPAGSSCGSNKPPPGDNNNDGKKNLRPEPSARKEGHGHDTEVKAEEWSRSSGEPPLTGLSKHFNSSTIRGRANVAKATFALLGLYTVYRMLRKEPREY